jgi:hypothetical protein
MHRQFTTSLSSLSYINTAKPHVNVHYYTCNMTPSAQLCHTLLVLDLIYPTTCFVRVFRPSSSVMLKFNNLYTGPKAGMVLVGHADTNSHALSNTRKLPVYSTCRLCQQTQTLNLLVVVQGQCTMGCTADESGMEGGFSAP